ncbi:phage tail protein [Achromobacter xylosoxidans]|uniref:phage tail protein n=1 Tax=Alcaligenes xylosoxydans xylosoxydans TaxID=85698 RepID=UPI001F12FAE6|nr:phage tail protein [Achromobacter xylosoxidans]
MQELEQIPIGQQANDGTGDPLRNGMAKVNANFTKVQAGVDAVELTLTSTTQTATEAKTKADAAIPAAQKGMAGGVAPLDASGKVPATHLPELADYIPVEDKGAAGGVAPLDAGAKVPVANLPAGTAGGVAPLDASGKVPAVNLPAAEDSIPLSQKGQPGGVATLDTGGKVPAGQLPPIPTGPPAGSVAWWPLRSSIPAGQIPADGQTISRATFPDLAAMVVAGTVPVATESDWLADPRNRGCYTAGDGSTTIRVPDLNGRSSGTLGRIFLSGDGADSNGVWGVIQRDQFQKHHHYINLKTASGASDVYGTSPYGSGTGSQYSTWGEAIQFNPQVGPPRSGDKTHPQNVAGVWTVQAFGAVTNPGSADAAQLASDYAVLNAGFQTLNAGFQTVRGQAFGVGQSMQNVAGSRTIGVAYTNTTGRPIVVYIAGDTNTSAGGNLGITIGGLFVARSIWASQGIALAVTAVIPPGIAYVANASGISLSQWQEYR